MWPKPIIKIKIKNWVSCSNYSKCAKTRRWPRFDQCSRWILTIPGRTSLTVMLELGILTYLRMAITLGQWLKQTIWHAVRILTSLVCPADEAYPLMKVKWNRYTSPHGRTAAHKRFNVPHFYTELFLRLLPDSIKTPFLARVRPNSTTSVPRYLLWLALGHRLWSRHGVLKTKAVS